MILIADAGSTKTDWLAMDKDKRRLSFQCKGLNPVTATDKHIQEQLETTFPDKDFRNAIRTIHFFGAGCFNEATSHRIRQSIQTHFPHVEVQVQSDLLGAVKATCGDQAGITCILGTGSNSCWYDGEIIVDNIPALGYQLGDEGSGAYLGKQLIKQFFYRELPSELQAAFVKTYSLQKQEVIERVYRQPGANRYLASFAPFLKTNLRHPHVLNLLKNSFDKFLVRHVFKYPVYTTVPIHFVGSIAFHFQEQLVACLDNYQLTIGSILEKPIIGLERYYMG